MLITTILPKNILSFGDDQAPIELAALNILVGHNGSGKSNLIECVRLLQAATKGQLAPPLEWLWQGQKNQPVARLEAVINYPVGSRNLRYWLEFTANDNRLQLTDERVENEHPDPGHPKSYFYFAYQKGWPVVNVKSVRRQLKREEIQTELSILAQRKHPESYPEISWLGEAFSTIRIYQDWSFGPNAPLRLAEKAGLPDDFVAESHANLCTILNGLCQAPETKKKILGYLSALSPPPQDVGVNFVDGYAQIFVKEANFMISAARLSDGTLRFLSLLAILCHPLPPPLICIEEPEWGLHPEMMPALARLLRDASQRTQLIVSTHSDLLVEEFTASPENVLVFEKREGQTVTRRLDALALENWLDKFTLGAERLED
jgi:predicted ATPase